MFCMCSIDDLKKILTSSKLLGRSKNHVHKIAEIKFCRALATVDLIKSKKIERFQIGRGQKAPNEKFTTTAFEQNIALSYRIPNETELV